MSKFIKEVGKDISNVFDFLLFAFKCVLALGAVGLLVAVTLATGPWAIVIVVLILAALHGSDRKR